MSADDEYTNTSSTKSSIIRDKGLIHRNFCSNDESDIIDEYHNEDGIEFSSKETDDYYKFNVERLRAGADKQAREVLPPLSTTVEKDLKEFEDVFYQYVPKAEIRTMESRLKSAYKFETMSCPQHVGDQLVYLYNNGEYDSCVLMKEDLPKKGKKEKDATKPTIIVDPGKDGNVISNFCASTDGEYVACAIRTGKQPYNENIHMKLLKPNINSITDFEIVQTVHFTSIVWSRDNNGFFFTLNNNFVRSGSLIYYHECIRIPKDILVMDFGRQPFWRLKLHLSENGKFLIIIVSSDKPGNLLYFAITPDDYDIKGLLQYVQVVRKWKRNYKYVTSYGAKMIFLTDRYAPKGCLVEIDFNNKVPKCHCSWKIKLPQKDDVLLYDVVSYKKYKYFCHYLQPNGNSYYSTYTIDERTFKEIYRFKLENLFISEITTNKNNIVYIKTESLCTPPIVSKLDFSDSKLIEPKIELLKHSNPSGYDDFKYTMEYYAEENLNITITLKTKNDEDKKRSKYCLMIINGGFGELNVPLFEPCLFEFLRMDDVCIAHIMIPGGGEQGRLWQKAGQLHNKPIFLKLIPKATKYLKEKYADNILISGYNNGGLITASCILKFTDLFSGALCLEPIINLTGPSINKDQQSLGDIYVREYGNPIFCKNDNQSIQQYLPLTLIDENKDNLKNKFPPILITSSLTYEKIKLFHGYDFTKDLIKTLGQDFTKVGPILFHHYEIPRVFPRLISEIVTRYSEIILFMSNIVMKN